MQKKYVEEGDAHLIHKKLTPVPKGGVWSKQLAMCASPNVKQHTIIYTISTDRDKHNIISNIYVSRTYNISIINIFKYKYKLTDKIEYLH